MKIWIGLCAALLFYPPAAAAFTTADCTVLQYQDGSALVIDPPITLEAFIEPGNTGLPIECTQINDPDIGAYLLVREVDRRATGTLFFEHAGEYVALYEVLEDFPEGLLVARCDPLGTELTCAAFYDTRSSVRLTVVSNAQGAVTRFAFSVDIAGLLQQTDMSQLFIAVDETERGIEVVVTPSGQRIELTYGPENESYYVDSLDALSALVSLIAPETGNGFSVNARVDAPGGSGYFEQPVNPQVTASVYQGLQYLQSMAFLHRTDR